MRAGTIGVETGRAQVRRHRRMGLLGLAGALVALAVGAGLLAGCGQAGGGTSASGAPAPAGSSSPVASRSASAAVSTAAVSFEQGGLELTYDTPTLQTEDSGGMPVSLSEAGSFVFDRDSSQIITPITLVPSGGGPPAMVMVMTLSEAPAWLSQLKGMSQSEFGDYLPTYEQTVRKNIAERVRSIGTAVKDWSVTSGTAGTVPAVTIRLRIVAGGQRLDEQVRFLVTRHDLYTVAFLTEDGVAAADRQALRRAFQSISVKW